MYQIAQAVLYVCVLYFMAGFDRTAGKWLLHTCSEAVKSHHILIIDHWDCSDLQNKVATTMTYKVMLSLSVLTGALLQALMTFLSVSLHIA